VTLTLYVLRLLCAAVVVSAGGLFFIAIPGVVVGAVHKLGVVNMAALLGFLPLVLVDLVPYLLPIGFLLALVSTYGRLAADNEWTAISMAGIHPVRMMLPALVIALVLGGMSHWLTTEISPSLSFLKREYAARHVVESFRNMNAGRTEVPLNDFYLSAKSRDFKSNTFRDVTIHIPSKARAAGEAASASEAGSTVLADVAEFSFHGDSMRIDLTRARSANAINAVQIKHIAVEVDIDDLLKIKSKNRLEWRYQTSNELGRMLDAGEVAPEDVRKAIFELHSRRTRTATFFMFLLLGVPTGLLLRRGTQLGALAAAVGYALVYYLLSVRLGKTLASWGTIPPAVSAWAITVAGCLAGLWLCWKAFRK